MLFIKLRVCYERKGRSKCIRHSKEEVVSLSKHIRDRVYL